MENFQITHEAVTVSFSCARRFRISLCLAQPPVAPGVLTLAVGAWVCSSNLERRDYSRLWCWGTSCS